MWCLNKTLVGVPTVKEIRMKLEELKALVTEHTADDVVNYEELNKVINSKFDGLIEAKVTKAKELAKNENIAEFIKEQGYENIDQFTSSVKNTKATSSELSEKVTRYEAELEALRNDNLQLKSTNDEYTYLSKLNNVDDKYKKFVMSEIKGLVNDTTDFATAQEQYLANNAHYLKDSEPIVTKTPKGGQPITKPDSITSILEAKHGIKLE